MDKTLIVHKWTKPCEVLNSISPLASFCKESCLGNVGSYIKFYFSRSGIKDQYKQLWCFAVICLNTYYRYRTRKEFVIYTSLLERSLECAFLHSAIYPEWRLHYKRVNGLYKAAIPTPLQRHGEWVMSGYDPCPDILTSTACLVQRGEIICTR